MGTLVAVALVSYTFVIAPKLVSSSHSGAPAAAASVPAAKSASQKPRGVFPPEGRDFIGVTTTEGTFDFGPVDTFIKAASHQPAVMMFSQGWAVHTFDRNAFDQVARRGMMPMLSWEPWNYRDDSVAKDGTHAIQPQYKLSRIIAGDFDDYIRSYAEGVKSLDYHIGIRFAHEMNGFWYPWGADVNGNQPGEYIAAWRHVHDIFTSAGVTNVIWVWSANVTFDNKIRLASLYPGDDYVDWVGLSGYYGTAGTQNYRSPDSIFNATITELRTFTKKPIVITETAATEAAGLKVKWINDFAQYLPKHRDIIGFIWYEAVRETDWRIVSSQAAAAAFSQLAADPLYSVKWTGDLLPRATVDTAGPDISAGPSSGRASPTPAPTSRKATPGPTRTTGPPTPRTTTPGPARTSTRPPAPPPTTGTNPTPTGTPAG
jgi:mannan endo-1,4-beta-mannosidase